MYNAIEASRYMGKLIEGISDPNIIAIKDLLGKMICTTTLYEDDAVTLLKIFLQTGNLPLNEYLKH